MSAGVVFITIFLVIVFATFVFVTSEDAKSISTKDNINIKYEYEKKLIEYPYNFSRKVHHEYFNLRNFVIGEMLQALKNNDGARYEALREVANRLNIMFDNIHEFNMQRKFKEYIEYPFDEDVRKYEEQKRQEEQEFIVFKEKRKNGDTN